MAPCSLSLMSAASFSFFFFFFLVPPVVPQTSCRVGGVPGIPGIPGRHGANGQDGAKGERGDAGDSAQPIRGQKGSAGLWGPPGRPGPKGEPGQQGLQGNPGQQGAKGRAFNPANRHKSFFSLKREIPQTPELETNIDFNSAFRPDLEQQFQGESLINSSYVSSVSGVYFFSYHVSAKSRVCLRLMKAAVSQLMMCDSSEGFLVSSGSAVLQLNAGEAVSLQTYKYNNLVTTQSSTSHTFTGFLLFPTA